jgi:Siphovirus Gp157
MNDPRRLDYEKQRYVAFKQRLLADDPELDERTLADTLEGLTDLHAALAATVRAVLEDETGAAVLKVRMQEMADRLDRFQRRADKRREIVRDAMTEVGWKRLDEPDFTATVRQASPHVVVVDEKAIPQTFFEMRPHLRKRDLLDALKDGATIEGAALSNPGMTLSVRTR